MNSLWYKTTAFGAVSLWSLTALAAHNSSTVVASPAPGTSVTDVSAEAVPAKPLPLSLSDLSFLFGPPVNDPTSSSMADDSIGSVTGISSRHQISLMYKINDKMKIGPVADFDVQLTDPTAGGVNRGFRWRDSFVKLSRASLIDTSLSGNDITLSGDIRYFVPSSLGSRTNKTIGGLRLSLNPSMQIGKSPFSLSAVNFARQWIQSQDTAANGSALVSTQLYTGPQVNYSISDSVTAFVLYETNVVFNTAGISNMDDPSASLADVEPGVDLKLHDRVTITPFLNWYTNQPLSTTSINMAASITLL